MLVPTTLLAQQHFADVQRPLRGLPGARRGAVALPHAGAGQEGRRRRGDGEVDIVIGTHRLLSEDVQFKDLGLLVVDEEQRFGVQHKEAIKKLPTDVDVLTLTATPIPRTLEMSLTGIRDLTLLNTPPADRQPILTYVGEYDERAVAEAIRRELLPRGPGVLRAQPGAGHRARSRPSIRELVPEARIAVAHGQMDEGSSSRSVSTSGRAQYDVLVCTTIIESGIDMPTVNTLVVDRADLLGLGQLHQLRGRVGRAGQRAYAYLFHPARPGAQRGGVRAAADDRRGHRAGLGVQDRDARPRDPRRRQPARREADRPHRGGRLRPLLPDGQRGGGRAEGRGAARAGRDQARPAGRRPPAARLCREGGAAARGVSTAGDGHDRRPRSTTSGPSGRTATGRCRRPPRRCSGWRGCGPSATASASARSAWLAAWCGSRRSTSRRARRSLPPARPRRRVKPDLGDAAARAAQGATCRRWSSTSSASCGPLTTGVDESR